MWKALVAMLVGGAPAAALTYYLLVAGASAGGAAQDDARVAPQASLASTAEIDPRSTASSAQTTALEAARGVEQGAEELPEHQRAAYQADALARLAADDPRGAIAAALVLRDAFARVMSIQRIGLEWAGRDAIAALAHADALPRELRARFVETVAEEWARLDAAALVAYLEGRSGVQHTALLRAEVAAAYARTDPGAAMAWVRSLDPRQPTLEAEVIGHAALIDVDRAIEWFDELVQPAGATSQGGPAGAMARNVALHAANHPRRAEIATRLRARSDDPRMVDLLRRVTERWVDIDPAGLLDWMLTSGGAVDAALAGNVAAQLAPRDPELAAAYVERMPPELRGVWLEHVAARYARQAPERAASWLAQFRAEPAYEDILRDVVLGTAETDPRTAARLLESAPESVRAGATSNVAAAWARDDLTAAGQWAANLPTSAGQVDAVEAVASAWAYRAPDAAQRWALSLPRGELRDAALTAIASRFASEGYDVPVERRVLEAFDSNERRERP